MLFGGYGSGKTYALVMKLLKLAALNRGYPGGILSPTNMMFKRDVEPTFGAILDKAEISYKYLSSKGLIRIPKLACVMYVFHSEDDGLSIRGPNLAYGGVNEITLCSEKAFKAFLARIRVKDAKLRQVAGVGTPEGFNWTYNMFVADPRKDADIYFGDMRLNPFVADEYAQMLVDSYDDIMVQQYVGGKFVNTTNGAALYKFSRQVHTGKVERDRSRPVWVSLDFNVRPMSATLWNAYPDDKGIKLRAFDEVCIMGSDSYELGDVLREKIGNIETAVLFPDGIGGSQDRTSAKNNISDIEILESKGFKDIRYKTSLSVRDCLNAANAFVGKGHILLDKDNCRETIKDFEQCTLKPGTHSIDKKDLMRSHWLDGFKNMIDYEFPIQGTVAGWRTMQVR